jgi:hypothetical protein
MSVSFGILVKCFLTTTKRQKRRKIEMLAFFFFLPSLRLFLVFHLKIKLRDEQEREKLSDLSSPAMMMMMMMNAL